jgi:hypothetical protein
MGCFLGGEHYPRVQNNQAQQASQTQWRQKAARNTGQANRHKKPAAQPMRALPNNIASIHASKRENSVNEEYVLSEYVNVIFVLINLLLYINNPHL